MKGPGSIAWRLAVASLLVCGTIPSAASGDLSKYRGFQFGSDLAAVARQAGTGLSAAKAIHSRPALIQELEWRPQTLGPSVQAESVNEAAFRFFNGQLYRIEVKYDRYETEGLTAQDIVDALSSVYGPAILPAARAKAERYEDRDEIVAQWQDAEHSFDLIRSAYATTFRLVGVLKRFDSAAGAAIQDAQRLDDQEAPQRDAARAAGEQDAAKARLEKARVANKLRFRP
jgi:hypothetical protein